MKVRIVGAVMLLTLAGTASAQSLNVVERKLDNGLTVLIVERHNAPIVSFNLKFRVGSVDEQAGMTGVAHILEHMLFKGTPYWGTKDYEKEKPLLAEIERLFLDFRKKKWALPKSILNDTVRFRQVLEMVYRIADNLAHPGKTDVLETAKDLAALSKLAGDAPVQPLVALRTEFLKVQEKLEELVVPEEDWKILQKNGARGLNASTGPDSTQYFYSLPSNRIELWALIESNRLRHPVLRQFYKEKEAIKEERRLRIDSNPMGLMYATFNSAAYHSHSYRWPVIGWMSDIEEVSRTEVEQFFKRNYAPNRAVATIVGDVNPDEMMKIIEKYFGDIPAQPEPRPVITVETPPLGERRVSLTLPSNPSPSLIMGYHRPAIGHPDFYVLDVITGILTSGRTSRLTQEIYFKQRLGQVQAGNQDSRYPGMFLFSGTPMPGHTLAELEAAIVGQLDRLKTEPVPDVEITKIKNQNEAAFLRSLKENAQLAEILGTYEVLYGWEYVTSYRDRLAAVTPEDIMRVAKKYFVRSHKVVVTLEPEEKEAEK